MDPNLRALGGAAAVRAFGLTFIGPYAALYLLNVGGVPFVTIGLVLAVIGIPPLLWGPLAGLLTDRIGRRVVLLGSVLGEGGCCAAIAAAVALHSTVGFVLGLAALAIVGTTGGPALAGYISDFTEGSERTRAFTWYRIGHNAGFALGVASGGAVVAFYGFLDASLLAALALAGAGVVLSVYVGPSPFDRLLRDTRAASPAVTLPSRPSAGSSLRPLARDRLFLTTALAFALSALVVAQWGTTYSLYASHTLHLSYAVIGLGFALNGLLVVVGQGATTSAVIGRSHTRIGAVGTAVYAVSFLFLGLAPRVPGLLLPIFFGATALLTFGENLLTIPTSTLPSNLAPVGEIGSYNGAFQTLLGIGGLIAGILGGVALASFPDPMLLWSVLVAPAVPAILLLQWVQGRLPARPNRA
jgi:MFS family permease